MVLTEKVYLQNFVSLKEGVEICKKWEIDINEYYLDKQFKNLHYKFGKGNAIRIRNVDLVNFIVYASPVIKNKPDLRFSNTETKLRNTTFDYTDTVNNQTGVSLFKMRRPAQMLVHAQSYNSYFSNEANQGTVQPNTVPLLVLMLDYFECLLNGSDVDIVLFKGKALNLLNQLNHHYTHNICKGHSPVNGDDLPPQEKFIPAASSSISKFIQAYKYTLLAYGFDVSMTDISTTNKSVMEITVKANDGLSRLDTELISLNEVSMMLGLSTTFIAEEARLGKIHNSQDNGSYGFLLQDIANYTNLNYPGLYSLREFNFDYVVPEKKQEVVQVPVIVETTKDQVEVKVELPKLAHPGIATEPIRKEKPLVLEDIQDITFTKTDDEAMLNAVGYSIVTGDGLVEDYVVDKSLVNAYRVSSHDLKDTTPRDQEATDAAYNQFLKREVVSLANSLDSGELNSNGTLGDLLDPVLHENKPYGESILNSLCRSNPGISSKSIETMADLIAKKSGRLVTFEEATKELGVTRDYLRKLCFEHPQVMYVNGDRVDIHIDQIKPYCELLHLSSITDMLRSLAKNFNENFPEVAKRSNTFLNADIAFNRCAYDLFQLLGLCVDEIYFNKYDLKHFLLNFLDKLNGSDEIKSVEPENKALEEVSS